MPLIHKIKPSDKAAVEAAKASIVNGDSPVLGVHGTYDPRVVTDPVTGTRLRFSSSPQSAMYTWPLECCDDVRSGCRWMMVWESPDLAVSDGAQHYLIGKTWQGGSIGVWTFDSDLHCTDLVCKTITSGPYPLIGHTHVGTSTYDNLDGLTECVCSLAAGGAGQIGLLTVDQSTGALTDVGVIDPTGLDIDSVAIDSSNTAYMVKSAITEDGIRIIGGSIHTAGGYHAALLTNSSFDTTGWSVIPLVFGDTATMMVHQLAVSGSGATAKILAACGNLYGGSHCAVVYSADGGSSFDILAPSGAESLAAGGISDTDMTTGGYWLTNADADLICPNRILISGTKAYMVASHYTSTTSEPFENLSENTQVYLYAIDLTAKTYTRHGPFLVGAFGWHGGPDAEMHDGLVRLAKAIPDIGNNPDAAYSDYPQGGPSLGVYTWDPSAPDTAPVLTDTITLANLQSTSDGSDYDYVDRVPYLYPAHSEGYGDGQVILGWRFVKNAEGLLALNVSDQRVTNVDLCFHASRVMMIDLASVPTPTRTATAGPHIVVATSNMIPSASAQKGKAVSFGTSASVAVGDYEPDLCFGANAFSVVLALNITQIGQYARLFASLGQPLLTFVDLIKSGTYVGYPQNGWEIRNFSSSVAPSLCWYNGYDGINAAKWRRAQVSMSGYRYGTWATVAISKAASSAAAIASFNGASVTPSVTGSATQMTNPTASPFDDLGARVRLFHSIDPSAFAAYQSPFTPANASFQGAAGIWVVGGALTQTQLNAITADVPSLSSIMDPTAFLASYEQSIVFRSYAGERAWWPI